MPLCPSQASRPCTASHLRPPAGSPPRPFLDPHGSGSEHAVLPTSPNPTETLRLEFASLLCPTKSGPRSESVLGACGIPAGWSVLRRAPTPCPPSIMAAWVASALLTCVLT